MADLMARASAPTSFASWSAAVALRPSSLLSTPSIAFLFASSSSETYTFKVVDGVECPMILEVDFTSAPDATSLVANV